MPHQRQTIRNAVVTLLDAALDSSVTVVSNRVYSVRNDVLPLVNVTTRSEEISDENVCNDEKLRFLTVLVDVYVTGTDASVDDTLDGYADAIETALEGDDYTWSSTVSNSELTSTEFETTDDGEKVMGKMTLTYRATYRY